ncbi:MAG TPA: hypothetical protein VGO27_19865 [Candidatus Acidoferrum sp.]|jgi:hypothetical protein|nr:hypothetical protein [Candidatus Acidoferrum sp.]
MLQLLSIEGWEKKQTLKPHGSKRYCRQFRTQCCLDEIRNPGLSPVVVSVTISGKLGLDNNTRIVGGAFGLAA